MRLVFLLFFSFAYGSGARHFIKEHRDRHLNHSAPACEDFYQHVCPNSLEYENFMYRKIEREFEKKLEPFIPKEVKEFIEDIEKITASTADTAYRFLINHTKRRLTTMILPRIAQYEAFQRYIRNSSEFVQREQEVYHLFNMSKIYMKQAFTKTPWIRYENPETIDSLKKTTFYTINQTYIRFHENMNDMSTKLKTCTEKAGMNNVRISRCLETVDNELEKSFHSLTGKDNNFVFLVRGASVFNAALFKRGDIQFVIIQPCLISEFYQSLAEHLGSFGFILTHELGHTAFPLGNYQPSNAECFQKHQESVCQKHFGKKNCPPGNYTFNEDAADFAGIHASLDMLKRNTKKLTKEDVKDFFYARAILSCGRGDPMFDVHSSHRVRANAIFRQFDEFSWAFDCKDGDFMKTSPETRCKPLIGPGAPAY